MQYNCRARRQRYQQSYRGGLFCNSCHSCSADQVAGGSNGPHAMRQWVVNFASSNETLPPVYSAPSKSTTPPVNSALWKQTALPVNYVWRETVLSANFALLKKTSPPANSAPLKETSPVGAELVIHGAELRHHWREHPA